jgi:hypothetical protein
MSTQDKDLIAGVNMQQLLSHYRGDYRFFGMFLPFQVHVKHAGKAEALVEILFPQEQKEELLPFEEPAEPLTVFDWYKRMRTSLFILSLLLEIPNPCTLDVRMGDPYRNGLSYLVTTEEEQEPEAIAVSLSIPETMAPLLDQDFVLPIKEVEIEHVGAGRIRVFLLGDWQAVKVENA